MEARRRPAVLLGQLTCSFRIERTSYHDDMRRMHKVFKTQCTVPANNDLLTMEGCAFIDKFLLAVKKCRHSKLENYKFTADDTTDSELDSEDMEANETQYFGKLTCTMRIVDLNSNLLYEDLIKFIRTFAGKHTSNFARDESVVRLEGHLFLDRFFDVLSKIKKSMKMHDQEFEADGPAPVSISEKVEVAQIFGKMTCTMYTDISAQSYQDDLIKVYKCLSKEHSYNINHKEHMSCEGHMFLHEFLDVFMALESMKLRSFRFHQNKNKNNNNNNNDNSNSNNTEEPKPEENSNKADGAADDKSNNQKSDKNNKAGAIVLGVYVHCQGCAETLARSLRGFEGVEEVKINAKNHRVIVKGESADPAPKVQELGLNMLFNCEGCLKDAKHGIHKIEGVQSVTVEMEKSLVTVKGTMDPENLVEHIIKRFGRHAEIVIPKNKNKDKKDGDQKEENQNAGSPYPNVPSGLNYAAELFSDENPNACLSM